MREFSCLAKQRHEGKTLTTAEDLPNEKRKGMEYKILPQSYSLYKWPGLLTPYG